VTLFVLIPFISAPLALVVWLCLRRRPDDRLILDALDRVLEEDSTLLKEARGTDPLRFRTAERVRLGGVAMGWGLRPGRVHLVRTIRSATAAGYRLRLRAFARGAGGRTLVRTRDVELRRA
jgi:hypothetical protein